MENRRKWHIFLTKMSDEWDQYFQCFQPFLKITLKIRCFEKFKTSRISKTRILVFWLWCMIYFVTGKKR